jgi:raffinose/stachyose/melibiose transport system permease protein
MNDSPSGVAAVAVQEPLLTESQLEARRRAFGPDGSGEKRPRAGLRQGWSRWSGYAFVIPGFAVFAAFVIVPLCQTFWLSFYSWDGLTARRWVGLANYRSLYTDPELRSAFYHSAILVLFISIFPVALGLLLAAALSVRRVRGMTFFRTILFFPQVLPLVVVGVIWDWMYQPGGPVNSALRAIGLGSVARAWLGDFRWALPAVGVIGTWVTYGFCMVLFIAGVQKIPMSLYDAAKVDGSGAVREFFAVTLPGLSNELVVAFTLTVIAALRTFDVIYVTTLGGPGVATTVPSLEIYRRAFVYNEVGSAAAVSVALALIIFVVTFLILRRGDRGS